LNLKFLGLRFFSNHFISFFFNPSVYKLSTMKAVTSFFLVALLVASAFADCVTRGPVDNLIITAKAKTLQEMKNTQALIFPFVVRCEYYFFLKIFLSFLTKY